MKISEQIAAGRAHLAGPGEADTDEISIYSCWAIAYAGKKLHFQEDPAVKWYLGWLRENEIIHACAIRQESGFYSLSHEEQQNFRFLLMCFAELAAIDEGL